ncbi:cathepsin O isoform X5 [Phycodurus eques]|uniref:cathepsin O isoform X5 n=1 Tax=Phycodurus eques TaxID=693459 RepID=UPI002ACE45B3|nr:cathepsin O isoform X5 [Phycodurus eques]
MKGGYRCAVAMATVFAVVALLCCQINASWDEELKNLSELVDDFTPFGARCHLMYEGKGDFERFNGCFRNATERHAYLNIFSSQPQSAKYGINQFSSLSPKEFRDLYLRATSERTTPFLRAKAKELPAKFDWRDRAVVGPVQNQQATKVKLVPQSDYPYTAKNGMCHFFLQSQRGVGVGNFTAHNFSGQEEAMKAELAERGPLSVVVDAVSWQDYLGGIIQHHCSSRWPNHAVLLVGYDATGEIPFWIVQNSWGRDWGSEGYVFTSPFKMECLLWLSSNPVGSTLIFSLRRLLPGIADSVAAVFV